MKKKWLLLLMLLGIMGLVACGKKDDEEITTEENVKQEDTQESTFESNMQSTEGKEINEFADMSSEELEPWMYLSPEEIKAGEAKTTSNLTFWNTSVDFNIPTGLYSTSKGGDDDNTYVYEVFQSDFAEDIFPVTAYCQINLFASTLDFDGMVQQIKLDFQDLGLDVEPQEYTTSNGLKVVYCNSLNNTEDSDGNYTGRLGAFIMVKESMFYHVSYLDLYTTTDPEGLEAPTPEKISELFEITVN